MGLARPFARQPGWDQTEALLADPRNEGVFGIDLDDEPTATLDGLTKSVADTVTVLTDRCTALMLKRRTDPALLVQSGRQWPKYFEENLLAFDGYGSRFGKINQAAINVGPDMAARMRAFRIGDKWAADWKR